MSQPISTNDKSRRQHGLLRAVWWLIGISGRVIIVGFVLLIGAVFIFPPFGPVSRNFVGLTGDEAKNRLGQFIPVDINRQSGYGNQLCSAYDASTRTLWIFDVSQQHDQLWPRGKIPAGDQFVLSRNQATDNELKGGN